MLRVKLFSPSIHKIQYIFIWSTTFHCSWSSYRPFLRGIYRSHRLSVPSENENEMQHIFINALTLLICFICLLALTGRHPSFISSSSSFSLPLAPTLSQHISLKINNRTHQSRQHDVMSAVCMCVCVFLTGIKLCKISISCQRFILYPWLTRFGLEPSL